jgi:serine protease Do
MKSLACLLIASGLAFAQQPAAAPVAAAKPAVTHKRAQSLHQFSRELETLSQRVGRSVVQIFSTGYRLNEESDAGTKTAVVTRQSATGSGVIVSADGYIVTNRHVVANARRVRVRVAEAASAPGHDRTLHPAGRMLDARVVGVDRGADVAVLKIERQGLSHLSFGDSERLRQGQLVMAFGNPLGLENSVSMGVVSSVGRQLRPDDSMIYIQTDAPINPGNSGGPLVDADGRVMGINTFILSQSGGSEGLGFAIPSNIVKSLYQQIRKDGHVHRGEIGVSGQTITPELAAGLHLEQDWGVLLADVYPGGPAEAAGLKVRDIALSINGKTLENARQLQVDLFRHQVGDKVKIEVLRGHERLAYTVAVTVEADDPERFADMVDPAKNIIPELGVLGIEIDKKIAEMVPDTRKKFGIVVAAHASEPRLSGGPLQLGDIIYSVNTEPVTSILSLRMAIRSALTDATSMVLQIERDGRLLYLTMETE